MNRGLLAGDIRRSGLDIKRLFQTVIVVIAGKGAP